MTRPTGWKGFGWATQAGCPQCQGMPSSSWFFNWGCADVWACPVCGQEWNPYTQSPYFVPMLYSGMALDTDSQVQNLLAAYPGRAWIIWNEPDLRQVQATGNDPGYPPPTPTPSPGTWVPLSPIVAARNYARAYWFIKTHDPTAWVGGPNLVCMDANGRCTTGPWSQMNGGADYFQAFVQELRRFAAGQGKPVPRFDFYCVHTWSYKNEQTGITAGGMLPLDGSGRATFATLSNHINWVRDPQFVDVLSPYAHIWITETGHESGQSYGDVITRFMDPLVAWLDSTGFSRLVTHVAWYASTDAMGPENLPNPGDLLMDAHNAKGRFEDASSFSSWQADGGAQVNISEHALSLSGSRCVRILNTHAGWWPMLFQSVTLPSSGNVLFGFYHQNGGDMYGGHTGAHVKIGYSPNTDAIYNSGLLDGDGANHVRHSVALTMGPGAIWITLVGSPALGKWHFFDDVLFRRQNAMITPLGAHWGALA